MTAVDFDYADIIPTVRRAHSRANLDDVEEAISQAVVETLAAGKPLKASYVVTRARSRLIDRFGRREAQNSSLDAALEETPESAPRELAIEKVDFDAHVQLAEAASHPILSRRLGAVQAGAAPRLTARGAANHRCLYSDETVARARAMREAGASYGEISAATGANPGTIGDWVRGKCRQLPTDPGWTRDMCLAGVRAVAAEIGRTPSSKMILTEARLPSVKVWLRFFPTWNDMIVAAGLIPNRPGPRRG